MKAHTESPNRRKFLCNMAGILAISAISPNQIFAAKASQSLSFGILGLKTSIKESIFEALTSDFFGNISENANRSDILFIGANSKVEAEKIAKNIHKNSLLIIESKSPILLQGNFKNVLLSKGGNLVIVEKWADESIENKIFEKIKFFENNTGNIDINRTIHFLTVLEKLTAKTGLQVIA
ncbi:MAG: hypothetical protein V4683_12695 [Bacteroidota bacterium]